ncbi:hypothetical protein RV12_GL002512 [Enterococcus quebecensis]|nr:hypothetical protein RV12_GL002512 [Enterococcus quebecensis]
MLLMWIAMVSAVALVLFVVGLFCLTLSCVDDVEVSYFI